MNNMKTILFIGLSYFFDKLKRNKNILNRFSCQIPQPPTKSEITGEITPD